MSPPEEWLAYLTASFPRVSGDEPNIMGIA